MMIVGGDSIREVAGVHDTNEERDSLNDEAVIMMGCALKGLNSRRSYGDIQAACMVIGNGNNTPLDDCAFNLIIVIYRALFVNIKY